MVKVEEVTDVQFGLYQKPVDRGEISYLQAKHFSDYGSLVRDVDTYLKADAKNESHLLEEGDVLLTAKGHRIFAWAYTPELGPAIASSIFFVLKANTAMILPNFLAVTFNLPDTKAQFQALGAGSSVPSIRKSELEAFTFTLPTLKKQEEIIQFKKLYDRDIELSQKIMGVKRRIYDNALKELLLKKQ